MMQANLLLAALVAGATTIILALALGAADRSSWLSTLAIIAWALSPLVLVVLLAWIVRGYRAASLIVFAGLVLLGVSGSYLYYDGVLAHFTPDSELVLVFVPLLQWGAATILGCLILIAIVVERRFRAR